MNNYDIGIISGYFNPIHAGHIEYANCAKTYCNKLICIINNDIQVNLKQSLVFMDDRHRKIIMENIKSIDEAIISIDKDLSVSSTLKMIVNHIYTNNPSTTIAFFNSGDRLPNNQNAKEEEICINYNIDKIYLPLPKIFSSSILKRNSAPQNIK